MTKLIWGTPDDKTFEAGVDRGVLYAPGFPGVPWNGLRAIKENPSGGSPQPYYLDGMKYANVSSSEEFNATLEAFSSPSEFSICDGSVRLAAGLYATQQPRQPFGLAYRTKVGDAIRGISADYKLHLVYNALAAPSGRDNNTQTNTIDPMVLSWDIATRPPLASGFKPTAHFIIDTRDVDSSVLLTLENILYGSSTATSSMPTPNDIIELLSNVNRQPYPDTFYPDELYSA